jgi:hypothetical protein
MTPKDKIDMILCQKDKMHLIKKIFIKTIRDMRELISLNKLYKIDKIHKLKVDKDIINIMNSKLLLQNLNKLKIRVINLFPQMIEILKETILPNISKFKLHKRTSQKLLQDPSKILEKNRRSLNIRLKMILTKSREILSLF